MLGVLIGIVSECFEFYLDLIGILGSLIGILSENLKVLSGPCRGAQNSYRDLSGCLEFISGFGRDACDSFCDCIGMLRLIICLVSHALVFL